MTAPEYLPITAFARICGVSPKTLRFYGDIGLFRPAWIDPRTRYRFYLHDQLRDFVQIQLMRECGASLTEIRAARRATRSEREQRDFLRKLRAAKLQAIDEARRSLMWIEGALEDLDAQFPLHASLTYSAPVKIASLRTDVESYGHIERYERMLSDAVGARRHHGLKGVLWHRCADGGLLEAEPFLEVGKDAARRAGYEIKELPGVFVARAFSSLDDEEAEETYIGLSRWIRARGHRLGGARREIYRGNMLEIQYPLAE